MEIEENLKFLLNQLVEEDAYSIETVEKEKEIKFFVSLPKEQMGRVVGKGGKMAISIRELMKTFPNTKKRVFIKFNEAK